MQQPRIAIGVKTVWRSDTRGATCDALTHSRHSEDERAGAQLVPVLDDLRALTPSTSRQNGVGSAIIRASQRG